MTEAEFLDWARTRTDARYELVDGRPVAMASQRAAHVRIKAAAHRTLRDGVKRMALPCEVFEHSPGARIGKRIRIPDGSEQCGPAVDADSLFVDAPVVLVEVLSLTTAVTDTVAKFTKYFTLPSLRRCLILDPETSTAVHHSRQAGGGIETRIVTSGPIRLDPPGFAIECAELFATA